MKITIDTKATLEAASAVAAVTPKRSPSPILSSLKIDTGQNSATITGTNGGTHASRKVNAEIIDPGSVCVSAERFVSILKTIGDSPTAALTIDGSQLIIKAGASKFRLFIEDASNFPAWPEADKPKAATMPGTRLAALIRDTLPCTDNEGSRYAIAGVLLKLGPKGTEMVATNGRMLIVAKADASAPTPVSAIIPSADAQRIASWFGESEAVTITVTDNITTIADDLAGCVYTAPQVQGAFPPYETIIKDLAEPETWFTVQPLELASAVKCAAMVYNPESNSIAVRVADGGVAVLGHDPAVGDAHVDTPYVVNAKANVEALLNWQYLLTGLRAMTGETKVALNAKKPNVLTSEGRTFVLMPINRV